MHNILSAQIPYFETKPWEHPSPDIQKRVNGLIGKDWKPDLFSNVSPDLHFNGSFKKVKTFDEKGRPLDDTYQRLFNDTDGTKRFKEFDQGAYTKQHILKSPKGDKILYLGKEQDLYYNPKTVINVAKVRKPKQIKFKLNTNQ